MMISDAVFDPTRVYRYSLTRRWAEPAGMVAFIGLNPSTATEVKNDPTVTRCIKYAKRWGYAGMYMLNAFAFRSTDPKLLYKVADPVGPDNDAHILEVCREAARIVLCYGTHGTHRDRCVQLMELLWDVPLWCLGTTKHGLPRHPLYLRSDADLIPYLVWP